MKNTLLAFLILSCLGFIASYDRDSGLVEIAPDFKVDASFVDLPETNRIHEVFRNLKAAKGDYRSFKPELHLVKNTGRGIAVAYDLSGVVKMEMKGYELCKEFGPDSSDHALALLLGHELTHIYEKHKWENLFAWEYSLTSLKDSVTNEQKKDEIQADYLGTVLAYLAGYKVFNLMPRFLDKVYESYELDDEKLKASYPGIEQRKLIAPVTVDKFEYFSNYFEIANLLAIKGEHEDALMYYDEVLQEFKSREVYNNIGYISMQAALDHFTPEENKFYYPIELDMESRMNQSRGSQKIDKSFRVRKLLDAIHYFDYAIHLDPHYPIAYLNKACANALLGIARPANQDLEWLDASVSVKRALNLSEGEIQWQSTFTNTIVAEGILSALLGKNMEAINYFKNAQDLNPDHLIARANQSVLDENIMNPFEISGDFFDAEYIDNKPLTEIDMGAEQLVDDLWKTDSTFVRLWHQDFLNSYVLTSESTMIAGPERGDTISTYHIFQITKPDYDGRTTKGITMQNGNYANITKAYGEPYRQTSLGNGSFLYYRYKDPHTSRYTKQELIFQLGPDGKLKRWAIYYLFE